MMKKKNVKELSTVLHGQDINLKELKTRTDNLRNDKEFDEIVAKGSALAGPLEFEENALSRIDNSHNYDAPSFSWDELVNYHQTTLENHTINPGDLSLDSLLTPEIKAEVDKAWMIWPEAERWQLSDYILVAVAGLAGGALDLWLSNKFSNWIEKGKKIEKKILYDKGKEFREKFGTEIKKPMSNHPIDAKLPKEILNGAGQDYHRLWTHDLCEYRKLLELMMGKESDIIVDGQSVAELSGGLLRKIGVKGDAATVFTTFSDPDQANFALCSHLYADFFSSRSLPLPGSKVLVDKGVLSKDFVTWVYTNGITMRSVTMGFGKFGGAVLTEGLLRLGILLQRWLRNETPYCDWSSSKRRYNEMLLVAHSIAAGVGGVAYLSTGNLLMLNYSAIVLTAKYAIQLALRVHNEKQKVLEEFATLVENNNKCFDELRTRQLSLQIAQS